MKTDPQMLEEHVIYGTWDDVTSTEVLVFYHPNGKTAHVFVMGGTDYGGGISRHARMDADIVDKAWKIAEDDYDFHEEMRRICEELSANAKAAPR